MLDGLTMPAIAEAIEATLNEEMAWFGRALPFVWSMLWQSSLLIAVLFALDWVLRGRIVTPEVALELGLVHEVVDDSVTRALELAKEIALLPPMAVANAKRALYQGADTHLQAAFGVGARQARDDGSAQIGICG